MYSSDQVKPDEVEKSPSWKTGSGMVMCGFLLVAGFYLVTEHTAHTFGFLPLLLILACPVMHFFHHHGHGGHGSQKSFGGVAGGKRMERRT